MIERLHGAAAGMLGGIILAGLVGLAATAAHGENLPGEGRTVRMAQGNWLGANYVQNQIVISALERLGYDVDLKSLGSAVFYQAAAQGDIDFWADGNWPQQEPMFDAVADRVELVGEGTIEGGGLNGYLIDKATSEKYGLTNIAQLKDPEIAKLFDSDGDGKANLSQCDFGWGCGDLVVHQIKAFELEDTVESVQAKYEVLMAEVLARFRRGEPVIYYAWSPSWLMHELTPGQQVVWLEIPFDSLPDGMEPVSSKVPGVVGCAGGHDPCHMAQGPWNYMVVGNKSFFDADPAVRALMEQVSWPAKTWSAWEKEINEGANTDEAVRRMADSWIAKNGETFEKWIKAALAAT